MTSLPLECTLILAYAFTLGLIAFLLEWVAGHAHRRSLAVSTAGFTYHRDRDVWQCPKDQHLFPILSDSVRGKVIYRAPATACRVCPSKAACTDSDHGREVERDLGTVESGMKHFHRAISLMLMVLACLILGVEVFRTGHGSARITLVAALGLFCLLVRFLVAGFRKNDPRVKATP